MGGNTRGSNKGKTKVTFGNSSQTNSYYTSSTDSNGNTRVNFT